METIKVNAFAYGNKKIIIPDGKNLEGIIDGLKHINEQIDKTAGSSTVVLADSIGGDCLKKYGYEIL
ncbi:MAG: hypothetical protein LBH25_08510 [Fibromonadaceae bacterium]|jgi:hypothetical protein|nr:hypothetical protein [Fibromonadaceae bacterium]